MASFILCPECGFCIGKYADFVENAKQSLYREQAYGDDAKYADYSPDKVVFDPSITPPLQGVFDALHIKNRCCRMHMLQNALKFIFSMSITMEFVPFEMDGVFIQFPPFLAF